MYARGTAPHVRGLCPLRGERGPTTPVARVSRARRRTPGGSGFRVANAARLRLGHAYALYADPPVTRGLRLPRRLGAPHRPRHGLGGFASLVVRVIFADLPTDSGA
uniref:Uncharacterized protein n=1 Tax=Oryza glumipatula TaxID=40148 RepID=A0A0D9ZYG1_9ORYZ